MQSIHSKHAEQLSQRVEDYLKGKTNVFLGCELMNKTIC